MDEAIPTMPASEAARLDREDAERRRRPETPDEKWWRQMNNIHARAAYTAVAGPTYEYQHEPGSGATPARPWRPEQHAADTPGILGHFRGKAGTDE